MMHTHLMQGGNHAVLKLQEPLLHLTPGFRGGDNIQQLNHFTLTALYVGDIQHISDHYTRNAFETLLQMRLHPGGEYGKEM